MQHMNTQDPPDALEPILESYCNVNAFDLVDLLGHHIESGKIPIDIVLQFKEQLREAILHDSLSPADYKRITGENEYTTQAELHAWLCELWYMAFPNENIV